MADLYHELVARVGDARHPLTLDVVELRVEERLDAATALLVVLADPFRLLSHALREGVALELTQGSEEGVFPIFRGVIYRVEGRYPHFGEPTLTAIAYDGRMRLGLRRRTRRLSGRRLSAMMRTIAGPTFSGSALDMQLADDPELASGVYQADETDLTLLFRLAHQFGAAVTLDPGADREILRISDLRRAYGGAPLVLAYGRDGAETPLATFEGTSSVDRTRPLHVGGIDSAGGGRSAPPPLPSAIGRFDRALTDDDPLLGEHLQQFGEAAPGRLESLDALIDAADRLDPGAHLEPVQTAAIAGFDTAARLRGLAGHRPGLNQRGQQGRGRLPGDFRLRAPERIQLVGVGRFTGEWFLTETVHRLDRQGFTTEFECSR